MMRKTIPFFLFSLFFLVIPISYAQLSIGVSPPILDLGEIEPGQSKIARFNLVTSSEEVSLVRLESSPGNSKIFRRNEYKDLIHNYSEEDVSSWVEFISNPVELESINQGRTIGGSRIRGAKEMTFILRVPEDAEPGYHTGLISLDPVAPETGRMFTIKTVVPLTYIFKVPGKAVREGKILDLSSGSYKPNRLTVNVFFKNTGTVTLETSPAEIKVFDKYNRTIDTLSSNMGRVKPGEMRRFTASWDVRDVEEGKYNATARIDFLSGSAFKRSLLDVHKKIVPPAKVVEKGFVFPWWVLIVLIIIIFATYLYYRS